MAQYFRLGRPGIHAISVDGIEHTVNDDGLLEVEVATPNLARELQGMNAQRVDPEAERKRLDEGSGNPTFPANAQIEPQLGQLTPAEQAEREALFVKLDNLTGKKVDRRRSLKQLRDLDASLHEVKQTMAADPNRI